METKSKILERVIGVMPYPFQISNIDLSFDNSIRFSWRGIIFRVDENFNVDTVENGLLCGSNISIILSSLLKTSK